MNLYRLKMAHVESSIWSSMGLGGTWDNIVHRRPVRSLHPVEQVLVAGLGLGFEVLGFEVLGFGFGVDSLKSVACVLWIRVWG